MYACLKSDGEQPTAQAPEWGDGTTLEPSAIYQVYFHGPAFQVLGGAQANEEHVVGQFQTNLPQMMGDDKETLVAPLWIELCLQTAGVWEIGQSGVMALPTAIDQVLVHAPVPLAQGSNGAMYAEITPRTCAEDELCFDAQVMDEKGNLYLELKGYRTAKLPSSVEEALVAPIRALVGEPSS